MLESKMFGDCNSRKITGISLDFHESEAALKKENIFICTVDSAKKERILQL